jgi:serine protease Do
MLSSVKPVAFVTVALALLAPPAFAQQSLPSLPGPGGQAPANTPPAAPAAQAAQGPTTPQQLYEHVRRGVVVVMKNGVPAAIGTVLGTDGRILTALSGLGGAEGADVLYADGTTVHAKLGNTDAADDLALLVPATHKVSEGLTASELDPIGAQIRALLPNRGAKLAPTQADVKGKADAHTREGAPLLQMLDVDVKGPLVAGAPLLDSTGGVVAVLVRACKGAATQQPEAANPWAGWGSVPQATAKAAACAPVVVGAPVSTIRSFLTKLPSAPAAAAAPAPWLGIRGETQSDGQVRGVRVLAVAPKSPAEAAGLKSAGDVIAAVDGQSVDSPEKLSDAIAKHAPGETVKLLVFGDGRFREVSVVLRAAQ